MSYNMLHKNHCFTTPSGSTGRGLVKLTKSYESWTCIYILSQSNDMQFTNCTTRKPLFHESYGSWTCIYTPSPSNDMQFTNCTTRTGRGLVYTPQVPLMICSSQTVRLVSHSFTTRMSHTSRTGRGLVYTPQVPLMICSSQTVRLVSHCFTTCTSRTGSGLVYTPQVPLMIHRKLFKIPSWESNGKFSLYWENPGTRNSFLGKILEISHSQDLLNGFLLGI